MSVTAACLAALVAVAAASVALAADAPAAETPANLVANPDFAAGPPDAPEGWTAWTPEWKAAACTVGRTDAGLRVASAGDPWAVGGVRQVVAGIRPGQAYAVAAEAAIEGIDAPLRAASVRLEWLRGGKAEHPAGVLVRQRAAEAGRAVFDDILVAPEGADAVRVTLEVKWPGRGAVVWRRVSLTPTQPPPARKVKLGAVYMRPKNSTPEKNMDLWCAKIDEAGRLGLDAVCLGEAIMSVGTPARLEDVARPIPGPDTQRLGEAARRNRLWVVAGLMERDGERVYNTAVLMDRQGRLAGTYRKVHLPREEWTKGVTPGTTYPVFRTDFGVVAIQICYDWFFPEAAEAFALAGAEVLFAPTWGTTFPDAEGRAEGETVFRVRARDNGLYIVPCVYDGASMVIDPLGRVLASNRGAEGVFWAEVDLAARERLFWVGRWRDIGPRDRMPETYGPLVAPARPAPSDGVE